MLNKCVCLLAGRQGMFPCICSYPADGIFHLTEGAAQTSESQRSSWSFHRAGLLRGVSACEQTAFGSLQPLL